MTGKEKCAVLREIRRSIAEANGIVYLSADCSYEGDDCLGTCPKCDAEIAYLDEELNKKAARGEQVTIAGISAGLLSSEMFAGRNTVSGDGADPKKIIDPDGRELMGESVPDPDRGFGPEGFEPADDPWESFGPDRTDIQGGMRASREPDGLIIPIEL